MMKNGCDHLCGEEDFRDEVVPLDWIRGAVVAASDGMDDVSRYGPGVHLVRAERLTEAERNAGLGTGTGGAHLLVFTRMPSMENREELALEGWLGRFRAWLEGTRIGVREVEVSERGLDGLIREVAGISDGERIAAALWVGYVPGKTAGPVSAVRKVGDANRWVPKIGGGDREGWHPLLGDAVYFRGEDANAFNAGMERLNGQLLVAYRFYGEEPGSRNRIALSRVDARGFAMDRKPLEMDAKVSAGIGNFRGIDDPRLFFHGGKLFCAVSSSAFPPYRTRMFYGEIAERDECWEFVSLYEPKRWFRKWRKQEKSWQFFESGGKLYVCYDHDRARFFRIEKGRVRRTIDSAPVRWDHGTIRGGTPPKPFGKDSLVTFFHSYLGGKGRGRVYYMGALVFDRTPPFAARMISAEPMLSADESILNLGPFPDRRVVFPCGALETENGYLVSVGVNDCDSVFLEITEEQMKLRMV